MHGWTAGALWEKVKFDLRHFVDIDRVTLFGDRTWEKGMAVFCKPFTTSEVRFFAPPERDQARGWLGLPRGPAAEGPNP